MDSLTTHRTDASVGQSDAEVKRRLIIESAAHLFDAKGYHRVNMAEIARSVGIQKPTIYHYFKSKSEILFGIHEAFFNPALAKAETIAAMPPQEALVTIMTDIVSLMDTHPGHLRVVFEHHRELTQPEQSIMRAKRGRYHACVEDAIARGIRAGVFRAVDPRLATLALFGMCNWAYQWYHRGPMTAQEVGTFMADVMLRGLLVQSDKCEDSLYPSDKSV